MQYAFLVTDSTFHNWLAVKRAGVENIYIYEVPKTVCYHTSFAFLYLCIKSLFYWPHLHIEPLAKERKEGGGGYIESIYSIAPAIQNFQGMWWWGLLRELGLCADEGRRL